MCTACDSDEAHPLSANSWVLRSAVDDGVPVDVEREVVWQFIEGGCGNWDDTCPGGPKLVGNDACNDFIRSFRREGDTGVWGDYRVQTMALCRGDLVDTLREFLSDDSFRYTIADGQLRLTSSSETVDLTLRASRSE
jgi:hypothetical protein